MKVILKFVLYAFVVCIVYSCNFASEQEIKVKVSLAKQSIFCKEFTSNGTLLPKEKAIVPFQVNEQIKALKAKDQILVYYRQR